MQSEPNCAYLRITDALKHVPSPDGKRFATVFTHGTLLVEIYAPRRHDPQQPHTRDEVYFVASGSGEFVCGNARQSFGPADILFVAAGETHRFENFSDDVAIWVMFYGPEGGEATKEK